MLPIQKFVLNNFLNQWCQHWKLLKWSRKTFPQDSHEFLTKNKMVTSITQCQIFSDISIS